MSVHLQNYLRCMRESGFTASDANQYMDGAHMGLSIEFFKEQESIDVLVRVHEVRKETI